MENEGQPITQSVQPLHQTPPLVSQSTNWSKTLLFTVLGLIVVAGSVFIGFQIGRNQSKQQIPQSQITPTATPSETNQVSPTTTPTVKPTTTTKPISIPSDWKQYTAIDPEFKIKTTMSMPPGFSFRFTGSEFTIQNDSDATELWDYSTSVFSGKDGLKNYYDGTSRRDWYERKLNGEFMIQEEYQKKRGDILSVNENNIGAQSYLEILVQPISGNQETHYIFLEDGIINIIKPASNETNSSNSQIPNYIGTIFASLKASPQK